MGLFSFVILLSCVKINNTRIDISCIFEYQNKQLKIMIMKILIINKVQEIKEFTGLQLTPCNYFNGLLELNGVKYFNVIIETRISESNIYDKLINIIPFNIISKVEPNGANRLAIFI